MESMAENSSLCLPGLMDHLWYHQLLFFKTSPSLKYQQLAYVAVQESDPPVCFLSSNVSQTPPISYDEEEAPSLTNDEIRSSPDEDEKAQETKGKFSSPTATERRSKLSNLVTKTVPSHPSSPRSLTKHAGEASSIRLEKTMSCKSLCELELEEVKGFMDLGFVFDTENMSKRMMSVLPGLQRLELCKKDGQNGLSDDFSSSIINDGTEAGVRDEENEENMKREVRRPYLSEAWLIKRSDSALVNLGIPSVCSGADMKKHIKYWAKTVASAVQQHSC